MVDFHSKSLIIDFIGNYNGDSSDDFRAPNNTVMLPANSTEADIYDWGVLFFTDSTTTLFSYSGSQNWTTFNDPAFTPLFFNADLTVMFGNASNAAAAEAVCNGGATDSNPEERRECYFDYLVTQNEAAAAATVAAAGALAAAQTALANFAPVVANSNATLQVEVSSSYTNLITIEATDANAGDTISYTATDVPAGVTVDAAGVVDWASVAYSDNGTFIISVTDGTASTPFNPQVALCACENGGTCNWDATSVDAWYIVPCDCTSGWTGDFCDEDIDGCAENPCFTACSDVPANQVLT